MDTILIRILAALFHCSLADAQVYYRDLEELIDDTCGQGAMREENMRADLGRARARTSRASRLRRAEFFRPRPRPALRLGI